MHSNTAYEAKNLYYSHALADWCRVAAMGGCVPKMIKSDNLNSV
jgi:hypothetical protein